MKIKLLSFVLVLMVVLAGCGSKTGGEEKLLKLISGFRWRLVGM